MASMADMPRQRIADHLGAGCGNARIVARASGPAFHVKLGRPQRRLAPLSKRSGLVPRETIVAQPGACRGSTMEIAWPNAVAPSPLRRSGVSFAFGLCCGAPTRHTTTKFNKIMLFPTRFDVIVVGGGHAGTEAALAARAHGPRDAAADPQHRNARADVVQSVDRRDRQGAPRQGGRRAGRRDGARHRRGRHPVPHPQLEQGAGGARDPRAGRPRALQAGHPVAPRERAEPHAVPASGRRPRRSTATAPTRA